jgi:Domain of unknown function (DUF4157)
MSQAALQHAPRKSAAQPAPSFTSIQGHRLQRKCACGGTRGPTGECEACRKKRLQRKTGQPSALDHQHSEVPPIVHEVLRSPGQPLDRETRAFMEPRFGHDFSNVRVHTNAKASESAREVNASAYTVGRDVVFGAGQYVPDSPASKRLLAHELVHVMQQRGSNHSVQAGRASAVENAEEREADFGASQIMAGNSFTSVQTSDVTLRRQSASTDAPADGRPGCRIGAGLPNTACSAYATNSWWLPFAYVNNATCACLETPNVPTAKCVRKFLQDRLAGTSGWLKALAATQKPLDNPATYTTYQAFVQTALTPHIYRDHVDAYASCCCSSGPAPYLDWVGVTSIPLPCPVVGAAIRQYGSCHGTPGAW